VTTQIRDIGRRVFDHLLTAHCRARDDRLDLIAEETTQPRNLQVFIRDVVQILREVGPPLA
jgi:hypothetical protein